LAESPTKSSRNRRTVNPSVVMTGKKMGIVIIMMEIWSMNAPMIRTMTIMTTTIDGGGPH